MCVQDLDNVRVPMQTLVLSSHHVVSVRSSLVVILRAEAERILPLLSPKSEALCKQGPILHEDLSQCSPGPTYLQRDAEPGNSGNLPVV